MDALALMSAGAQAEIEKRDAIIQQLNVVLTTLVHDLVGPGEVYHLPNERFRRTAKAGASVEVRATRTGLDLIAITAKAQDSEPPTAPAKAPKRAGKKQPAKAVE